MRKKTLAENIYNKWVKQEWAQPFLASGIYAIVLDNRKIIYVGKAQNILKRMSQHRAGIMAPAGKEHKYGVLHDLEKMGHKLRFIVLEREMSGSADALGEMEGHYIRKNLTPCLLNAQIPHEDNWREWDVNPKAGEITAEELLNEIQR